MKGCELGMGITSTLYFGYTDKSVEITDIETPFGNASVYASNQKIKFGYTSKKHTFKNGLCATIYRIEIDTSEYHLNDRFDVRIGEINKFEYYDSDENTVMQEFHNDKFCIAVIGYDSDYDFATNRFFGGQTFTFGTVGTEHGVSYIVVRNPEKSEFNEEQHIIYTWIIFLPVSNHYDAADLIEIELV